MIAHARIHCARRCARDGSDFYVAILCDEQGMLPLLGGGWVSEPRKTIAEVVAEATLEFERRGIPPIVVLS